MMDKKTFVSLMQKNEAKKKRIEYQKKQDIYVLEMTRNTRVAKYKPKLRQVKEV